jgi:lysophospholipase L1-like esterase
MKPNFATLCLLLFSAGHLVAESREPDWVGPMKQVHERFTGDAGTFAQFGDSITNSRAFWSSLRYERDNAPPEMLKAFGLVKERMIEDCWDGKGAKNGNEGRMTIRWAHQNVSQWLVTLNPEVAIVMFGTNDLTSVPAKEYEQKMREVVQRCLDNGTVAILSTIPPRHRFEEKSAQYADIVRSIADELKVPLIDYHAEILCRRPDDWDGALGKFQEYQGYDVPTLIARDGVHPSAPKKYRGDYSMESLSRNGYALRNYLTLLKYGEVIEHVLSKN